MSDKSRVGLCPYCGRRHGSGSEPCEAEIEAWQVDHWLREREDYEGLIAHYEAVVDWRPDDLNALYNLGDAYMLNKEPEKAIELLGEPHRQHPYCHDFQHVILAALFALGKDETDFEWTEEIPVFRLGPGALDRCHAYLKPKRTPRSIYDLHSQFYDGYCVFTDDELLAAVRRDDRFIVEEDVSGSRSEFEGSMTCVRRDQPAGRPVQAGDAGHRGSGAGAGARREWYL